MSDIIEKHYGNPHANMVAALAKSGAEILATLTPEKVHTWHMSSGIVGEAGELSEAVKKYVAYNKPLDRANVVEELGDLEFYMEGIRQGLGITRAETIANNIGKLNIRYSDAAAQARVDKA